MSHPSELILTSCAGVQAFAAADKAVRGGQPAAQPANLRERELPREAKRYGRIDTPHHDSWPSAAPAARRRGHGDGSRGTTAVSHPENDVTVSLLSDSGGSWDDLAPPAKRTRSQAAAAPPHPSASASGILKRDYQVKSRTRSASGNSTGGHQRTAASEKTLSCPTQDRLQHGVGSRASEDGSLSSGAYSKDHSGADPDFAVTSQPRSASASLDPETEMRRQLPLDSPRASLSHCSISVCVTEQFTKIFHSTCLKRN